MDIVRFKGGLGNQMFQYALVEALRSRGRKAGCNLGFYRIHSDMRPFVLDKIFPKVELNEVSDHIFQEIDEKWKVVKCDETRLQQIKMDLRNRFFYVEEKIGEYDSDIFKTKNCTFVGYWQTEKYFLDIKERIRGIYEFGYVEPKLNSLGKYLGKCYIGVHIRRTDYIGSSLHDIVFKEYYIQSINYIKNIMPEAKFIFFSDDRKWVSNHFEMEDMIICEPELFDDYKDWYDLYLMMLCKGNIIANSSFSWWGAWLNRATDQIVIAPSRWMSKYETPDIWCKEWIKMPVV